MIFKIILVKYFSKDDEIPVPIICLSQRRTVDSTSTAILGQVNLAEGRYDNQQRRIKQESHLSFDRNNTCNRKISTISEK